MPELPDLVHVERALRAGIVGREVADAKMGDPTVLRLMVREPFPQVLVGRRVKKVERRGHFMTFDLGEIWLVVNAMLAGRYYLDRPGAEKRGPKSFALLVAFDDGTELRYADEVRMGKVYVAPVGELDQIPQLGKLGIDIIGRAFTLDAFRKIARKRRDQVRQFLMDKSALASIGNAYADEILFAAKIHPKTFVRQLAPEEIDRLYESIRDVTANAIAEIARRDEPIDVKVRDFLKVRGRSGKPCPVCATKIRDVRVGDGDACFCPQCQPTGRKLFVDWGKLPAK